MCHTQLAGSRWSSSCAVQVDVHYRRRVVADVGDVSNREPEREPNDEVIFIEPRWPIALVLSGFIVVTVVLRLVEPERESLGPHWLAPALEVALLVALIAANPAHIAGARGGCVRCRSR